MSTQSPHPDASALSMMQTVESQVAQIQKDLVGLQKDVKPLKGLPEEVKMLQSTLTGNITDTRSLREDLKGVQGQITTLTTEAQKTREIVARMEGTMTAEQVRSTEWRQTILLNIQSEQARTEGREKRVLEFLQSYQTAEADRRMQERADERERQDKERAEREKVEKERLELERQEQEKERLAELELEKTRLEAVGRQEAASNQRLNQVLEAIKPVWDIVKTLVERILVPFGIGLMGMYLGKDYLSG